MCGASTQARPLPLTYNICLLLCVRPLPCLPLVWEGIGDERQGESHQGASTSLTPSPRVPEYEDVLENHFFCSHSLSSLATTVLPVKWRGVLQGKGDCRKYARTASGSCSLRPSMVSVILYFSLDYCLCQPWFLPI